MSRLLLALTLTAAAAMSTGGCARRQALTLGAAAASCAVLPLRASNAFDMPSLEEFDDRKARKYYATMPNPSANKQQSLAFYAVSTGDQDSLQAMVNAGWDLATVSDTAGKTVLHRAAQVGNGLAVDTLLKAGAKVDAMTQWKETPLHMAARTGQLACVKALVESGASLTKTTIGGDTALVLARKYRMARVEEYLASL
mmetsp:Transcript_4119/g.8910  ORF Transcript_4119/g.8910 Transcript_4119/m.8910 type:complete len:198 (-) Transcript_4119:327-920(-)